MGQKHQRLKRPCRICRKWFLPNSRLGDRQKTCGAPECQQKWHARKCAEWNRKNRSYFQEIYLRRRLESLAADPAEPLPPPCPPPAPSPALQCASPLDYPRGVVQEVIGAQQLVIIEYLVRLLARGVQEAIRAQLPETQGESRRLPPVAISRGDSQRGPPQGTLRRDP
jgi:hypothetical protein